MHRTEGRFLAGLALVAAVVLVAGCSSSSKSGGASTTTAGGGAAVTSTTVSNAHRVYGLGLCPAKYPAKPLTALNAGVEGLDKALVPFAALNVRICQYAKGALTGSGTLLPRGATPFGDEANQLPTVTTQPACRQPLGAPAYFVTLADDSHQVNLSDDACGSVSNGVRFAQATSSWTSELQLYSGTPG